MLHTIDSINCCSINVNVHEIIIIQIASIPVINITIFNKYIDLHNMRIYWPQTYRLQVMI